MAPGYSVRRTDLQAHTTRTSWPAFACGCGLGGAVFKRDQYRFSKATKEEKSELLKDLLGFANAWRRSDAYILIGVEDVRGARGNVVGISEHLDDHSLQQAVNHPTNKPVRFHYEAFSYAGRNVGVIQVDLTQTRPLYLKRDYGKLRADKVYVRRGSSTDPNSPATPEEIAEMGRSFTGSAETPRLLVCFADAARDVNLGDRLAWNARHLKMPASRTIPDYVQGHYAGINLGNANREFYRVSLGTQLSQTCFGQYG